MPTGTGPAGTGTSPEPGVSGSPSPRASGRERCSRPSSIRSRREAPPPAGQARAKPGQAPRKPRSCPVSIPWSAQLTLLVLRILHQPLRPSFPLPESSSPAQAVPSRPLPPKVRGSPTPTSPQAGSCGESAARSAAPGGDFPERAGSRRPAPDAGNPRTDARGPTRALCFTWQARRLSGDVRSRLLRGRRPAYIAASPTGQPVSRWVPLPPLTALPPPPTPQPPLSKVSQLFCLRIFCKVSVWSPRVGWQCQARSPCQSPAPPSRGPLRWAQPGRRAASSWSPSPERSARSSFCPSRLP